MLLILVYKKNYVHINVKLLVICILVEEQKFSNQIRHLVLSYLICFKIGKPCIII